MNHRKGTLEISSIINYFQDCSTFQSEDMNRGISYLQNSNRVWLLNSWQLEIYHPMCLGENITIGTWAYDFKGFYGYRNFVMKDHAGEVLAAANSIWVYLDTETGRPTRIPEDHSGYEMLPPYPMDYDK
ncbi:MAG TPA: acyl-ACP thioesterase domain-containing protein, partial [Mobilitalea sp.]|nr:acyl-ACP thioesterase domain-containing protein [Mobilitalea sp.]